MNVKQTENNYNKFSENFSNFKNQPFVDNCTVALLKNTNCVEFRGFCRLHLQQSQPRVTLPLVANVSI